MSEAILDQITVPASTEMQLPSEQVYALQERRREFLGLMVGKGVVSQEFVDSGLFNRFNIDEATGMDSVIHTYAGDLDGGVHHLPSLYALEVPGRVVASVVYQEDRKDPVTNEVITWVRQRSKFRTIQKPTTQNSYRCLSVSITDTDPRTGETFTYEKDDGSSMFPDDWSAEDVARAIVEVADTEPVKFNPDRMSRTHDAKVNGVRIQVVTSDRTGKIITGCPVVNT
jgi:hypothetical protein